MVEPFAAPPINPLISIQPLSTPAPNRDAAGAVPPQLANVPPGTLVEGFVVNRDPSGNPILRTNLGDILIKSDIFVRTGSEVVFRVDTTQPSHARIITIDKLSPQDYVQANARPATTDSISTSPLPAPVGSGGLGARATVAAPLQALLVNSTPLPAAQLVNNPLLMAVATGSTPLPAALIKLQQGAALEVRLLQIALPEQLTRGVTSNAAAAPEASSRSPVETTYQPRASAPPSPQPYGPALAQTQRFTNAQTARIALEGTAPPALPSSAPLTPSAPSTITSGTTITPQPAAGLPSAQQLVQLGAPTDVLNNIVNEAATAAAIRAKQASVTQPFPADEAAVSSSSPTAPPPSMVRPSVAPSAPMPTPAPTSTQVSNPPPNGGIPAQIIGHEGDGTAIVQTPLGTLKLHLPQPMPIGTALRLEIQPAPAGSPPIDEASVTSPTARSRSITTLAQHWPALEELMATIHSVDAGVARALTQAMPEIGPKLTSGMLFFVAAMKGGDLRQWLGNRAVSALEEKLPALATRLKTDMTQLQQLLVDSPLQQWNSAMIPMLYDGQLEHARLFYRRESNEGEKAARKAGDQRFILEVDLSHLGPMQFDGFVRKTPEKTRQFDLFVRSAAPLSDALVQQIRTTYSQTLEMSGLKGYLSFQHGGQHFVRPMADTASDGIQSGSQPILA